QRRRVTDRVVPECLAGGQLDRLEGYNGELVYARKSPISKRSGKVRFVDFSTKRLFHSLSPPGYQFQFAAYHSSQSPGSSQLFAAHGCPSQSGLLSRPPD